MKYISNQLADIKANPKSCFLKSLEINPMKQLQKTKRHFSNKHKIRDHNFATEKKVKMQIFAEGIISRTHFFL